MEKGAFTDSAPQNRPQNDNPRSRQGFQEDAPTATADQQRPSKLKFSDDELPAGEPDKKLANARRMAERTEQKLERTQQKLPSRRRLRVQTDFSPETGKASKHLKFEKEVKPQSAHIKGALPLRPVKKGANLAVGYAHRKLYQVEDENVGVKAAHRGEMAAEGGMRVLYRRHKTAPYRKVSKLQKKAAKTSAKATYRQALHDNPKLKSNLLSRFLQKKKIKRRYAKAAREAKRAGQAAKKTAVTTEKIAVRVILFIKRHPIVFGIIGLLLLLFFFISSVFTSCSSIGAGGAGSIAASTYLADDAQIDAAELAYTEWETDLLLQAKQLQSSRPGYDEYRLELDEVGHNPHELMGFLTAVYQNFTYAQVEGVLQTIFSEQYALTAAEEIEIRERITYYTVPGSGQVYTIKTPYEWHVLRIRLTAKPFSEAAASYMTEAQTQIYNVLMQTKGNRQYVGNVFGDTGWLPNVTSYYGYRVHPISGVKDNHKAADIGMAEGTEILAGHDGIVKQAGSAGDYGLIVVLEGQTADGRSLVTKYAHCSEILVRNGQQIRRGDVIARVGSTGNSTGPHLHLEVLLDGQYRNPLYFADTGSG